MMRAATATTGMTTAIAILAPVPRPPLLEEPDPDALSADGEEEDVVDVLAEDVVEEGGSGVGAGRVEVTITTEGACVGFVAGGV